MKIGKIRNIVLLVVFLLIAVGIVFRTGWGTLSSMGIGAIAYICPLGALETLLATWTGAPRQLFTLLAAVLIILLLGKAFCSWICPVPPLQRFLVGGKRQRAKDNVSEMVDDATQVPENEPSAGESLEKGTCTSCGRTDGKGSRIGIKIDSRHAVLVGTLASTAIFGFTVFCLVCPIGLIFGTLIALWGLLGFAHFSYSLIAFPVVLALELLFLRKWCHKFCPLSALMSLISIGNKTVIPTVDEGACLRVKGGSCNVCQSVCPELVDPHEKMIPECSKCGKCVDSCPAHAISISLMGRFGKQRQSKVVLAGAEDKLNEE